MNLKKILATVVVLTMVLSSMGVIAFAEGTTVAKIGEAEYKTLAELVTALNTASGDVTVEIYDKIVTTGISLNNINIKKLDFVGMDNDAEICLNGVGYVDIRNTNYPISYTNLTMSKINGSYSIDGDLGTYFSTYSAGNVTYTGCTFPNGVTAQGSTVGTTVTFENCTFNNTTSGKYSLWVYGNGTNVIVNGGTFSGVRGAKLYAENNSTFSTLKVTGATFSETITEKHAIVLTRGEKVEVANTIFNNTTGKVQVDDDYASSIEGKTVIIDGTEYVVNSEKLELDKVAPAISGTFNGGHLDKVSDERIQIGTDIANIKAQESIVVKIYTQDGTLIATTEWQKAFPVEYDKLSVATCIIGSSSSWKTTWEENMPRADFVPAYGTLYVDGQEMNSANIKLWFSEDVIVNWGDVQGVNPAPIATATYEVGVGKEYATLNDAMEKAIADGVIAPIYKVYGEVTLETLFSHGDWCLGTVEGADEAAKVTITGGGVTDIVNTTFKNLTFADNGEYLPTANEFMYQNFENCTFENVDFVDGIRLSGTTDMTNCTVTNVKDQEYAIWFDAGEFAVTGCEIISKDNGYGLVKSDAAESTLTLTNNSFECKNVAKKEALNTNGLIITATGNTFENCVAGVMPIDKTNTFNNQAATGESVDAIVKADNTVKATVVKNAENSKGTVSSVLWSNASVTEGVAWCAYSFQVTGEFSSVGVTTVNNGIELKEASTNPIANISGTALFGVVATGIDYLDAIVVDAQ